MCRLLDEQVDFWSDLVMGKLQLEVFSEWPACFHEKTNFYKKIFLRGCFVLCLLSLTLLFNLKVTNKMI